jgi:hypothetical protein
MSADPDERFSEACPPSPGRPAFGDNPGVDIVRLAAASSMRRLGEERDAAMAETRRLRELLDEVLSSVSILSAYDDTIGEQADAWRERAGLEDRS